MNWACPGDLVKDKRRGNIGIVLEVFPDWSKGVTDDIGEKAPSDDWLAIVHYPRARIQKQSLHELIIINTGS